MDMSKGILPFTHSSLCSKDCLVRGLSLPHPSHLLPASMLWTWTNSHLRPSSPSGFHCLKRIMALSRSSPWGLRPVPLGNSRPLQSHAQECQNTFALWLIIFRLHIRAMSRSLFFFSSSP